MRHWLQVVGWLACAAYSTIPAFWLMIHPFAGRWRARQRSPYVLLLSAWMTTWVVVALVTARWRSILLYRTDWAWAAAALMFLCGLYLYSQSGKNFSAKQLGGVPEIHGGNREQQLVTDGIRSQVRHPVYLAHSVRNAGVERGNRPRSVLGVDGTRCGHGSGNDPDGGCGVGDEVWGTLPHVSQIRAGGSAESVRAAPAIIRCN